MTPQRIPITSILISDRQRVDLGDIDGLAASIHAFGLIQPVVLDPDNRLVAGGRRVAACTSLGWTDIPFVSTEALTPFDRYMMELEENVRRKDITWQEQTLAIAEAHSKLEQKNALEGLRWLQAHTGAMLGFSQSHVSNALVIAAYLKQKDAEIIACPGMYEAIKVIVGRKEKLVAAELAKRVKNVARAAAPTTTSQVSAQTEAALSDILEGPELALTEDGVLSSTPDTTPRASVPISSLCRQGDIKSVLPLFDTASIDHVITDSPYGIDMDLLAQEGTGQANINRVREGHVISENLVDVKFCITECFRITKPHSFMIFWYDLDHHEKLQAHAREVGWCVQRWPLIWEKFGNCKNQAAQYNFTKNYEVAMVLRKSGAVLAKHQKDSVRMTAATPGQNPRDLGHPFAKPFELWKWLLEAVSIKGQTILDPFAGVGSMAVSAVDLDLIPFSVERDSTHFANLIVNIKARYTSKFGQAVSFE